MDSYAYRLRNSLLLVLALFAALILLGQSSAVQAATAVVSGQIVDDPADPAPPLEFCDVFGNCRIHIEAFPWDPYLGDYADYPVTVIPVGADGRYSMELPYGPYKLVPRDMYNALVMSPMATEVGLDEQNSNINVDFVATHTGIVGSVEFGGDPYNICNLDGTCRLIVEIYPLDPFSGQYMDYPMAFAEVNADGSFAAVVPYGTYKLVAVDPWQQLVFQPASQEGIVVDGVNGIVPAQPFAVTEPGITGHLTLDAPGSTELCDQFGQCRVMIEAYRWDEFSGQYSSYPDAWAPVNPDGSYHIPLPMGTYRATPVDTWNGLVFLPSAQEGLLLDPENAFAVADFIAVNAGISGRVDVNTGQSAGFEYCDVNGACRLMVEIYPFDELAQHYAKYPLMFAEVQADGTYSVELPFGIYKAVAVDTWNQLVFTPAQQESLVVDPQNGLANANFVASYSGISGRLALNVTNPESVPLCDSTGFCRVEVEAYLRDPYSGTYSPYPVMTARVAPDGTYAMELPFGDYRIEMKDLQQMLVFIPAAVDGLILDQQNGALQADFMATLAGISGRVLLDERDAGALQFCDPSGFCRIGVEFYGLDPFTGRYGDYPLATTQVKADGTYTLELPFGEYKVVPRDMWNELVFTPGFISGAILSPEQGTVIADFSASLTWISGRVDVQSIDPNFQYCSNLGCRLGVEIYALDPSTDTYGLYPVSFAPVAADGTYQMPLPWGIYKLVPVDLDNGLQFLPQQIEGVVLGGDQGSAPGMDFQGISSELGLMHVESVSLSLKKGKRGQWGAEAIVTVVDAQGNPLFGVEVRGIWSGSVLGNDSQVTSSHKKRYGEATFHSAAISGSGSVTFTVSEIIHPQYYYDATANGSDSDSVVK